MPDQEHISPENTQTGLAITVSLLLVAGIALLMRLQSPPALPVIIVLASVTFVITFIRTEAALIILTFSMLLSPEFAVGGITGRSVVIRGDDVFIIVIFLAWLAKMSLSKGFKELDSGSLGKPIIVYVFICLTATGINILQGHVDPVVSIFYLLKYVEYYLLFFVVMSSIKSMKEANILIFFLLLTSLIVAAHGWQLHFQGVERIAAPFDITEGGGESNTLAGYLLLIIALIMGLTIYARSFLHRISLLGLLGFLIPPFLFTQSRGAWLGFFPMCIFLIFFTKKGRPLLLAALLILVLSITLLSPRSVTDRVTSTFDEGKVYTVLGKEITIEPSAAARIENTRRILRKWSHRPFLGYGVTGVGLVDSQYSLVLGETGVIGLLVFIWLMAAILKEGIGSLNTVRDDWAKGLTLGFLAGYAGLLVHALSANTFIIVRIMGPFWFLAAIIVSLPRLSQDRTDLP